MGSIQSFPDTVTLPALPTPRLRIAGVAPVLHCLGRLGFGLIFPLLSLLLWQTACERVWLPPQILPDPVFVRDTAIDMLQSGELLGHLLVSLTRVAWSMAIGGSIGLALGFAMGLSRAAKAYLYPSFSLFSQFPVIAWSPLMIVFFGIDEALKISTITVAVIAPFAVATYKGIENVPAQLVEVGRIYRFSFWQRLLRIALPATLPAIVSGIRQGGMQAWLALVFVELMASSEGIGYLMVYARNLMQLDVVVVCMAAIGCVGLAFDLVLSRLEHYFGRWAPKGF